MQWIETFGYLGALLTLATFSMKTMLHLRMVGIVANVAFIGYGVFGAIYPVLLLHLTLLPLNAWRLRQLLLLTRRIEGAATGGFSVEWLKPFSRTRKLVAGEVMFRQGEPATDLLFILNGGFRAVEADVALGQGEVLGELGLVSRAQTRTQTVVCERDGAVLLLTYDEVRQMYYQNPRFGFFFLELVADRLMRDADRTARAHGSSSGPMVSTPSVA